MKTRSQTALLTNRNKRVSRKVVRLIDEYDKYTLGNYYGWNDTYVREYNIDDMYHVNIDSDEEEDYENFHLKRKEFRFQNVPLKRKKITNEGYDTSDSCIMNGESDVNWSDYENEL